MKAGVLAELRSSAPGYSVARQKVIETRTSKWLKAGVRQALSNCSQKPLHERLIMPGLAPFHRWAEPVSYFLFRVGIGRVTLTHGILKLLNEPHGSMADPMGGTTDMIRNVLDLTFAPQLTVAAMLVETIGALGVATGLFTRFFAAALAIEMVVAAVG